MRTRVAVAVAATTVVALLTIPAPSVAAASLGAATASNEARLLELVNRARAQAGVPLLTIDPAVVAVAEAWAQTMAERGGIPHNPDLGSQLSGWKLLAENVALGSDPDQVHRMLMESPTHFSNLTSPAFSLVGIGVVSRGGQLFVVENFVQPAAASSTGPADQAPSRRPAPRLGRRSPDTTTVTAPAPDPPIPAASPAANPVPVQAPRMSSRLAFVLEGLRALDDHNSRR